MKTKYSPSRILTSVFKLVVMASVLVHFLTASVGWTDELKPNSIYNLDTQWTNQDGKTLRLVDYSGQPVILAMVYLTCKFLCPTIISEVKNVESKMSPKLKKSVKVVLVSFDPARDTVKQMKQYAIKRHIDTSRWSLITQNNESNLRELAAVLNFKYQLQKDTGEFTHSFLIAGLDKNGVVVSKIEGANKDPTEFVRALEAAK